jgi:hypothetical protein
MADEHAPPRADVLPRVPTPVDMFELGGEFFTRLSRLLQVYLGVDPQQLSQIPRYKLVQYVIPAILTADATAPPWRKVGKAYQVGSARPASPGNASGLQVAVVPNGTIVAILDWIDLDAGAAERFQYGYTAAGAVTGTPATLTMIGVEDRPTTPKAANNVVPGMPTHSQLAINAAFATVHTDGTDFQALGFGATGPGITTRVVLGDVLIWPGIAVTVQGITLNTAIDVTFHVRAFDLSQIGTQNFTS